LASWDAFLERTTRRTRLAAFVGWALCVALGLTLGVLPPVHGSETVSVPLGTYLGFALLLAGLLAQAWDRAFSATFISSLVLALSLMAWKPPIPVRLLSDTELVRRHASEVTTFRGLSDVERCLPDVERIAHSEVGVPSLLFPRAEIIDLVGLQSNDGVLSDSFLKSLCGPSAPEVLFLPHKHYEGLNEALLSSPCFVNYGRMVDHSSSPLHLRRDLVAPFLACATDIFRWRDAR
jgi:hypothetical protein